MSPIHSKKFERSSGEVSRIEEPAKRTVRDLSTALPCRFVSVKQDNAGSAQWQRTFLVTWLCGKSGRVPVHPKGSESEEAAERAVCSNITSSTDNMELPHISDDGIESYDGSPARFHASRGVLYRC